jgi:predicted acetyltransferase
MSNNGTPQRSKGKGKGKPNRGRYGNRSETPKGRGKGIGKKMTEKLLSEAIENGSKYCVLHASLMGESIYKKLGFIGYGELETYSILKPKATSS